MPKLTCITAAAVLSACAALMAPASAGAASVCKGMEEAKCTASPGCRWIKAIVMKSGKPRKAHCRKVQTPKAN